MKCTNILAGLLLIAHSTFSQNIELHIHGKKLTDLLRIEQVLGSERLENKTIYISGPGVAQPIGFRRKETDLPDLAVHYFYFKQDSAIDYILYEWDDNNFTEHTEGEQRSEKEMNAFKDGYKKLFTRVFQTFGKSKSGSDPEDLSKIPTGDLSRVDTWEPDDSTQIECSVDLSNKYEKRGMVTITPAFRIRLEVHNLVKGGVDPGQMKLGADRLRTLDSVFKVFLSDLHRRDMNRVRSELSPLALKNASDQQLEKLANYIHNDDELLIYFSGVIMAMDGTSRIVLQYRYSSDNNTPPNEMIKVIFDENNKVAGIQPLGRIPTQ